MRASTAVDVQCFEQLFQQLKPQLDQVELVMRGEMDAESEVASRIGEHILASGGKRLRPALLFMVTRACSYEGPRTVGIAAALEMLHTASLLHDDVVDNATLRRGRPSVNAAWGNPRAVLVGDVLLANSCGLIAGDGDLEVFRLFTSILRGMANSQLLDIEASFDPNVGEAYYYRVIGGKTALLLSAVCEIGAIVANAAPSHRQRLARYGRELGLAFQLRDDALDFSGSEGELGKRPGTDLREGRVTLPLLLAIERCRPGERERIMAGVKSMATLAGVDALGEQEQRRVDSSLSEIIDLIRRYDGIVDTDRRAREHARLATSVLEPLGDNASTRALAGIATFVANREH